MTCIEAVATFFGGALLANAIPHTVAGMQGHAFQSPFASPPGKGLSSPAVNVAWGLANVAAGYALLARVGAFRAGDAGHFAIALAGAATIGLMLARAIGRLPRGDGLDAAERLR